jgi:hypothetical protein
VNPIRIICEDTPDSIPVPKELQHGRSEIIIWPLQADTGRSSAGGADSPDAPKRRRRVPPAALTGKVRELGDVMSSAPPSDWGLDE